MKIQTIILVLCLVVSIASAEECPTNPPAYNPDAFEHEMQSLSFGNNEIYSCHGAYTFPKIKGKAWTDWSKEDFDYVIGVYENSKNERDECFKELTYHKSEDASLMQKLYCYRDKAPRAGSTKSKSVSSTVKKSTDANKPSSSNSPKTTYNRADESRMFQDAFKAWRAENYEQASKLLQPIAENGDKSAQEYLGRLYSEIPGFKNDKLSVYWFEKAAAQGSQDAKAELAKLNSSTHQSQQQKTENTAERATKQRVNLPSQTGCISASASKKKGPDVGWVVFKNSCPFDVKIKWCDTVGCRNGTGAVTISGGSSYDTYASKQGGRININLLNACQTYSGSDEVYINDNGQCWANVLMK